MGSKDMKFLTYKSSKEQIEHSFVDGLSEEEQPQLLQLSNLLGNWKFKNRGSWLCSPQIVMKQLKKILDSDDVHIRTKLQDLSKIRLGKLANLRRALIIKNPAKSYNPRKFYVLLEDVNYMFKRTQWKKYFPPFRSAMEAHRNLHVLLGIFYNMYRDKYKDRTEGGKNNLVKFVDGQLVLVKFTKGRKCDNSYCYEVRRGIIENIGVDQNASEYVYTAYLLDFGFRMEVSDHFLCPLPRPFNCIAPLVISCSLYGVSPLGAKWCNEAIHNFSELLESHTDSVFVVDIMSDRLSPKPLIVNINVCKIEVMDKNGQKRKPRIKFDVNLTQFMINSQMGSQWNLFPARPKLMAGVQPSSSDDQDQTNHRKLPKTTVSYQDALLMTNIYIPHQHLRLPRLVIRKEFKKLFRLRHLSEIRDMTNYLVLQTADPNDCLKSPCTLKMLKTEENSGKGRAEPVEENQK